MKTLKRTKEMPKNVMYICWSKEKNDYLAWREEDGEMSFFEDGYKWYKITDKPTRKELKAKLDIYTRRSKGLKTKVEQLEKRTKELIKDNLHYQEQMKRYGQECNNRIKDKQSVIDSMVEVLKNEY